MYLANNRGIYVTKNINYTLWTCVTIIQLESVFTNKNIHFVELVNTIGCFRGETARD